MTVYAVPPPGPGLITDAYRASVYKVAVAFVHTSGGVDLAGVNGLAGSLPDILIFLYILCLPAPRLLFTRQDEDQPQLWVGLAQAQHGFGHKSSLNLYSSRKNVSNGERGMVMFWRRDKNWAAVFVDYEYWYVSMKALYHAVPAA